MHWGAIYCTGGNVLHWVQHPQCNSLHWGQFIAPHDNKLLPVQQIAPVRAGGEGPPRLRAARGCAPRLRVVVSSDIVRLAAVVLAAIEARTQGGRSLHGGSEGWGSRQRWCTAVAATAGGSGGGNGRRRQRRGNGRRTGRRFGGAAAGWLLWFDGGGARPSPHGLHAFSCSARACQGSGPRLGPGRESGLGSGLRSG